MQYRIATVIPVYLTLYTICFFGAFLLRFEMVMDRELLQVFYRSLPYVLAVKLAIALVSAEWKRSFRYATLTDLAHIGISTTCAAAILYSINLEFMSNLVGQQIPRSIILIDWVLSIPVLGGVRSSSRIYGEVIRPLFKKADKTRALVYGSAPDSIEILRAFQRADSEYQIVGLVDRNARKQGHIIAGLRIYSGRPGWVELSHSLNVTHILIPASVAGREVRDIINDCADSNIKIQVIPSVGDVVDGVYQLKVRDVTVSDLLRREPNQLDSSQIGKYIAGKRVLVTGAAGSIGSEICRQVLEFQPRSLALLDQSEFGIFQMEQSLQGLYSSNIDVQFIIADVTNTARVQTVMKEFQPELVLHAAAYKHVPLMEDNIPEAIRNNVFGTKNMVDLADEVGVERFILISTDKAVKPTSVMGSTKLVAEKYVSSASAWSKTHFVTVRFGNVLNSAGSVVPTFRRQIEAGGPITVTHPEINRFFMTIPEAVQLVLQAGALGSSGDIHILEMGEPVKIVDLAKDMIKLSGMRYPDDIDIVFTGLRPGEKLYEDLFYDLEEQATKVHDKIFCANCTNPVQLEMERDIKMLAEAMDMPNEEARTVLAKIVDAYVSAGVRDEEPAKAA